MAKPADGKDDNNPNNKQPMEVNQNLMMIINNVILIVVFIVSMFVMYVSLESSMDKKIAKLMPDAEQGADEEADDEKQEGILLNLGDFILNLADANTRKYLKVEVSMDLSKTAEEVEAASAPAEKPSGHGESAPKDPNEAIVAEMERYKPAIRDAVISVLSNKTSEELSSPTGKELAKEEIQESVNNIFGGQREVMRVSFGQFIIQ